MILGYLNFFEHCGEFFLGSGLSCQWPQSQQIYFSFVGAEKKKILGPLWDQTAYPSLASRRGPQFLFSSHFDLLLFDFGD